MLSSYEFLRNQILGPAGEYFDSLLIFHPCSSKNQHHRRSMCSYFCCWWEAYSEWYGIFPNISKPWVPILGFCCILKLQWIRSILTDLCRLSPSKMKSGKFAHAQTSINQLTSNSTLPWSVGFEEFRFFLLLCCFLWSFWKSVWNQLRFGVNGFRCYCCCLLKGKKYIRSLQQ